jgi:iron(III) transport system substrate-binding protein
MAVWQKADRIVAMRRRVATGGLLGLLAVAGAGQAPAMTQPTTTALMAYAEPQRTITLVAGAKREGSVNWYTSLPQSDSAPFAEAFEKKNGVKVVVWRASAENVIQRASAESRAGVFNADVFDLGSRELEGLYREKLLTPLNSPVFPDLLPQALPPHRGWVGTRLNAFAAAYNTNLIKKTELPKSYEDLTHPRWKGQLAVEADDYDWFAAIVAHYGEGKGLALFNEIATKNGLQSRKGHTLLTNLVASGEVPMALTNLIYKAQQLKNDGAPLDWFFLPPAMARVAGTAVAKTAAHPYAAVLFLDFILTDGERIMAARDFWVTNQKVQPLPPGLTLNFTDSAKMIDEGERWSALYQNVLSQQPK